MLELLHVWRHDCAFIKPHNQFFVEVLPKQSLLARLCFAFVILRKSRVTFIVLLKVNFCSSVRYFNFQDGKLLSSCVWKKVTPLILTFMLRYLHSLATLSILIPRFPDLTHAVKHTTPRTADRLGEEPEIIRNLIALFEFNVIQNVVGKV